jgi:hypothetical protein
MDQTLTVDHLYDTFRRYPGYRDMIELESDAIWSNWLTSDEIPLDRLIECKDGMTDAINYGWSAIIVDARGKKPRCERWHPKIDGVGFEVIETTYKGMPKKIQIAAKFNESKQPMNYKVSHYPCETQDDGEPIRERPIPGQFGFFVIRTRGGKKGIQGLPQYLHLIMVIRKAYDILENYATYAENQALGHLVIGIERNVEQVRARLKAQYQSQPDHRKISIIGKEDWAKWISPMNSSWDPWQMMEYIDKLIARATQMNKLMLEGDPSGNLSSSETAINNWESKTREKQGYWLGQFRPIFVALGAPEDVAFRNPSKPTFISLMDGLLKARQALEGIIAGEDIVKLFNEYLQKHGQQEELKIASPEERKSFLGVKDGESESSGNTKQPESNNRSKTKSEA